MILSGSLREKVTIANFTTSTVNEWGDQVAGTKTSVVRYAKVMPEIGKEIDDAETRRYSQRAKFIFRYPDSSTTINNESTLTWSGRAWQVVGFADPTGLKAELHVLAETSDNE